MGRPSTVAGLVASLVCLAALGCVAEPPPSFGPPTPPPVPRAGKSMIYLYWLRPPVDVVPDGLKNRANVLVDGKAVGNLTLGEYLAIEVDPGPHAVSREAGLGLGIYLPARQGEPVDAIAGQSHFIEIKGGSGGVELFPRAAEAGRAAIADLDLVAPAPGATPEDAPKAKAAERPKPNT